MTSNLMMQRDAIGSKEGPIHVSTNGGRSSIFAHGLPTDTAHFNRAFAFPDSGIAFNNAYAETIGGALDSRRDNAGGTAAHDAGWGTGGLLGGAQGDREMARRREVARRSQAAAAGAKSQKVQFDDEMTETFKEIKKGTDNLR